MITETVTSAETYINQMLNTCTVVEIFVSNTVIISSSMFNFPFICFLCFANVIGTTARKRNIVNNKRVMECSCFIFGVAMELDSTNIMLNLESNGTSFDAIISNFLQVRLD